MAFESAATSPRRRIPDSAGSSAVRCRCDELAVRQECYWPDRMRICLESGATGLRCRIPEPRFCLPISMRGHQARILLYNIVSGWPSRVPQQSASSDPRAGRFRLQIRLSSGENTTALTPSEWPSKVPRLVTVVESKSRTVLSDDADARNLPSGENTNFNILSEWPSRVPSSPRRQIPEPDDSVLRYRCGELAIRRADHCIDFIRMTFEKYHG